MREIDLLMRVERSRGGLILRGGLKAYALKRSLDELSDRGLLHAETKASGWHIYTLTDQGREVLKAYQEA